MKTRFIPRLCLLLLLSALTCLNLEAEVVTGSVVDAATKEPLLGASVFIKGTSIGTTTDLEGNFTLRSDHNSGTLTVSYIGYNPAEKSFVAGTPCTIELQEKSDVLDEIVVIGYGVQKKAT